MLRRNHQVIVRFRLRSGDADASVEEAHRRGVSMLPSPSNGVRAVFYLGVVEADVEAALSVIDSVVTMKS